MPQSLVKNYVHIVFSTKNRKPFIDDSIKEELFSYLGGICKNNESYPLIVGGHSDHVHILCSLSRKITLMKLVEELKTHSSKWIKTKSAKYEMFYWQRGYGGFSVHPQQTNGIRSYILGQEKHHHKISFKEEYLAILKEYNISWDERYVWD